MEFITLDSATSTNTWAAAHISTLPHLSIVRALSQTAGRGQRGNSWESSPGKNITLSAVLRLKDFPARRQFAISEATALAVVATLSDYGIDARVKWPNDIYVGDMKICGILIEHAVGGSTLLHSICGMGLNVNQERFVSDAPNPVSIHMLTGLVYDTDELTRCFARHFGRTVALLDSTTGITTLHSSFMARLWRGDGLTHPFRDISRNELFEGVISDVRPDGMLVIREIDGHERLFAFKEVEFIL